MIIHLPVPTSQRGAALITALVFLGVITLLSITSMRESTIGVRMAQNEEARLSGIQTAQALTEAVVATPAATPVIGGAGFSICTPGEPACNAYGIPLPAPLANEVAQGHVTATGRVEKGIAFVGITVEGFREDRVAVSPPLIVLIIHGSSIDWMQAIWCKARR